MGLRWHLSRCSAYFGLKALRTSFLLEDFGMHELRIDRDGVLQRCWFMVSASAAAFRQLFIGVLGDFHRVPIGFYYYNRLKKRIGLTGITK